MNVKIKRRLVIVLIITISIAIMIGLKSMKPVPEKKPVTDTAVLSGPEPKPP